MAGYLVSKETYPLSDSSKKAAAVEVFEERGGYATPVFRPDVDTSRVNEKALLRKVDIHVIPWLALLYLLNFLDRGAIGNAKLYNLEQDLQINDNQYLIALTVFFFPYALFEAPSNIVLRRIRPSIWLSLMIVAWGIVMVRAAAFKPIIYRLIRMAAQTMHGIVKDYGGLVTVRVLLGLTETGMYPGIVFYISSWYKRSEIGTRIAWFFSSATVAGAFSGLLAAAIQNMDGVGNLNGWRWIFLLEGMFTVLVGVVSFWVVQDFPDSAKFITEEERVFIIRRLQDDMKLTASGEKFKSNYVWQSLYDYKTWLAMGIYAGFDGPLFAFSLFTPAIISGLGYSSTAANLLSVPVYLFGCFMTLVVGMLGDRLGSRGYINMSLFSLGLVGYIILIASRVPALSYVAVYLAAAAIYPTIPNSVAWVAGNVEGAYKRGIVLGMSIGFGNLNGAVTSNVYRANDKPWYPMGHGIVLAYIAIGLICSIIYRVTLKKENALREQGLRDEVVDGIDNQSADELNGHYESVEAARVAKGDQWSGFRYSL